jgi:hypothetical protein
MTPAVRAALGAFLIFTAYFVAGSLVSDSMRFPYGYVSIGGLILFFAAGFFIARHYTARSAAIATAMASLLASLVAWLILALLNPDPKPQSSAIGEVVVLMTVAALGLGWAGAWVAGGTRRVTR